MKKIIALILSLLTIFSAVFSMSVSAVDDVEATYSITLYEDASKAKILQRWENRKSGDVLNIYEHTKKGYTFVSWIDDATKEAVVFNNDIIVVGEADAVYYIDWKINSYKLVYRDDNGFYEEFDVDYGAPAKDMPVPETVPAKEGYEFIGWSALPETMPANKTTITALWRDLDLEAKFYINYGDETPFYTESLLYGEPIFEPDTNPVKTGYSFVGWSFDGKKVVSGLELGTMGNEDVKIYAVWSANKYDATFVANGGVFSNGYDRKVLSVEYGTQIVFNEIPTRENFIFNGWEPAVGIMNNINGINFRATWIKADDVFYTVNIHTMDTNGKYTVESKKYKGFVGDVVTASYTINEGFELNKSKGNLTGVVTTDSALVLNVYIDRCLYDFCVNVDGVETVETYLYGEAVPAPATPSKDGYTFLQWVPALPLTMPAGDYTVTAVWTDNDAPHIHNTKEVVIEETCTENGKSYIICEDCGVTIGEETVLPAKGHTASEWIVVVEPTKDSEGERVRNCVVCNVTLEEEVIAKLPKYNGIKIINNPGTTTLKYAETLRVYAEVDSKYSDLKIKWTVSGEGAEIVATGKNYCEIEAVSDGTVMLSATVVGADGEDLRDESGAKVTDSQYISVKAGFLQKILAFFRMLFGMNNTIVQVFKVK